MEEEKKEAEVKELTETEKCGAIAKQKDKIQQGRSAFEKQWLINIAFLHGKQYFQIGKKPLAGLDEKIHWELTSLERKKKVRRIDNYILPLYRGLLAKMIAMKSHITVDATTNSERDKSAAKVSQEVLEDHWQMVNKNNPILCQKYVSMLMIMSKLFQYLLTTGIGWLKPYFNPKTIAKHALNEKIDEGEIGEIETKVMTGFDVFPDPMGKYIIEQSIMDVDDIETMYDKKVAPEDVGLSDSEEKLLNLLEGSKPEKYDNAARVLEKAQLPSKKWPNGRYEVCTTKVMLFEGDLPAEYKGKLPYFKFDYLDLMLASYSQGMIEQLISLQEELNNTVTRLAAYKKWMAGKIMVPKGSKMQTKWDDEVGQLIFYKHPQKPHYEAPPSPPSFLMEEYKRIRNSMEDVAAQHDASMGRVPGQAKSGVAIGNLSELDIGQLTPALIGIEQKLAFYAETVLNIVEAKYQEPRLLAITGELLGAEVKTFKGENVNGNKRIKISLGSSLPHTKEARQIYIRGLVKEGYITMEKGRELLEFGDIEGVFHSLDETLQKEENQAMLKEGMAVQVDEWDDHTIHAKTITDFMKTKQFFELDEKMRQKFVEHRKAHLQGVAAEQEAQATMQARAQLSAGKPPPGAGLQ